MMATVFHRLKQHVFIVIAVVVHVLSVSSMVYANQSGSTTSAPITVPAASAFPTPSVAGVPVNVSIPSVGIELSVLPGEYSQATDSWTLSGYDAHFATITRPANNGGGNTFIYGHNNKHVFGPIKNIPSDAKATVTADNGNVFTYALVAEKTTDPSDVSLFTYTGPPKLTIQTCTGLWNEKRQLYEFKLESVRESSKSVAIRSEAKRQQVIAVVATALQPNLTLPPFTEDGQKGMGQDNAEDLVQDTIPVVGPDSELQPQQTATNQEDADPGAFMSELPRFLTISPSVFAQFRL